MEVMVTARHFKASPELREEATKAARKFERFYDGIIRTEIVLANEKAAEPPNKVEFVVHITDHTLVVKEEGEEFEKLIHDASEKIVRQIRKLKTKSGD